MLNAPLEMQWVACLTLFLNPHTPTWILSLAYHYTQLRESNDNTADNHEDGSKK
jgi:hypothetical protein